MNTQDKQFIKYVPVQGEKHLGIAIVRWLGKIILRYKIMQSTQGQGYWVAAGSAKIGVKADGKDNYEEWFQLDSNYDSDEMKEFILMNVEPILKQSQGSVFGAPAPSQGNNYSNPVNQSTAPMLDNKAGENFDSLPF